jgi:hypothetical protein
MTNEATPDPADHDWLKRYSENARGRDTATTVVNFPPWRREEHTTRWRRRLRTFGVVLAAIATVGWAIALTLIGYTCLDRQATAAGGAQSQPVISPRDIMLERGAKLPIDPWPAAF